MKGFHQGPLSNVSYVIGLDIMIVKFYIELLYRFGTHVNRLGSESNSLMNYILNIKKRMESHCMSKKSQSPNFFNGLFGYKLKGTHSFLFFYLLYYYYLFFAKGISSCS